MLGTEWPSDNRLTEDISKLSSTWRGHLSSAAFHMTCGGPLHYGSNKRLEGMIRLHVLATTPIRHTLHCTQEVAVWLKGTGRSCKYSCEHLFLARKQAVPDHAKDTMLQR